MMPAIITDTDYYETASDSIILNQWNGFSFKFIEKEHYPLVLNQLHQNYYLDEPINHCTGMTSEREADMDEWLIKIMDLRHGSFYAHPDGEPDKVATVLLIWFQEEKDQFPKCTTPRSPITTKVQKAFDSLFSQYSIHKEHSLQIYPELFIISTDKPYRGKGLATEMCRKAIAKFKAQGYPLVSSTFTNPISRRLGDKLGFRVVSRKDFSEIKKDDGSLEFGEGSRELYVVEAVLFLQ